MKTAARSPFLSPFIKIRFTIPIYIGKFSSINVENDDKF